MQKNFFPIYKELLGDLETPVSLYLKLNLENSFLLESVTGGENVARFSYIGFNPFCIFKSETNKSKVSLDGAEYETTNNPIDELHKLTKQFTIIKDENLPDFLGGAIGFFSWETIFRLEKIKKIAKEKTCFPEAHFLFPGSVIIFDHVKRKVILLTLSEIKDDPNARNYLDKLEKFLSEPLNNSNSGIDIAINNSPFQDIKSNYKKSDFLHDIEKVKKYIHEGDIFQLVLSQRFSFQSTQDPFNVYRKLRFINPSPYMFYFNAGDYQLIGSSPEILVRSSNRVAELRPIAGTRLRQVTLKVNKK
ncbi:MAG: chorismate-binding protein [Candidatus Margulisiibacteriota bacterium]|jgi:anthranilate synthase component 1